MAAYYCDSSALVKRYVRETGSSWVASIVDPQPRNTIFTVLVTGVEIVAAISRRTRMGLISPPDATAAVNAFKSHFTAHYRIVLVTPTVVTRAMDLAERHGLRGYDAIQLASCACCAGGTCRRWRHGVHLLVR